MKHRAYLKQLDVLIKEYKNAVKPALREYLKARKESEKAKRFPNAHVHKECDAASAHLRAVSFAAEVNYHHKKKELRK